MNQSKEKKKHEETQISELWTNLVELKKNASVCKWTNPIARESKGAIQVDVRANATCAHVP